MSPTDRSTLGEDGLAALIREMAVHTLDSPDIESYASILSAYAQPPKRSDTSSRSLRGLANSTLVAYLPALRATGLVQNLTRLSLGRVEGDERGTST